MSTTMMFILEMLLVTVLIISLDNNNRLVITHTLTHDSDCVISRRLH